MVPACPAICKSGVSTYPRAVAPERILKWGGTGAKQKWGHRSGAKRRKKIFFGRAPPLFGSKSTISRFGERFRGGQYSLVSFLFAVVLLTVLPRAQPFVKVGARASRAPWSRRHCLCRHEFSKLENHSLFQAVFHLSICTFNPKAGLCLHVQMV